MLPFGGAQRGKGGGLAIKARRGSALLDPHRHREICGSGIGGSGLANIVLRAILCVGNWCETLFSGTVWRAILGVPRLMGLKGGRREGGGFVAAQCPCPMRARDSSRALEGNRVEGLGEGWASANQVNPCPRRGPQGMFLYTGAGPSLVYFVYVLLMSCNWEGRGGGYRRNSHQPKHPVRRSAFVGGVPSYNSSEGPRASGRDHVCNVCLAADLWLRDMIPNSGGGGGY